MGSFICNLDINRKHTYNEELYKESITISDTSFYKSGTYIYSYSPFIHRINIYKDNRYLKSFYLNTSFAEKNMAYLIGDIFYVRIELSGCESIFAYKDGEYYGRLELIDNVCVCDSNDNCVFEHEDVNASGVDFPYDNDYYYFTYNEVYYKTLYRGSKWSYGKFVIANGQIESCDFTIPKSEKARLKIYSFMFV